MNIHEAINLVAELKQRVLERQRFRGYSGVARAAGGTLALCAAAVLRVLGSGGSDGVVLAVWGAVFVGALLFNYGMVFWWRVSQRQCFAALAPAMEPLPVLLVGGVLTCALYWGGAARLLPGAWMCVFGLTQFTAKYALPRGIRFVGWFYIVAGTACLAFDLPGATSRMWHEPLVMGLVFFLGEWAGGLILHAETLNSRQTGDSGRKIFTHPQ